MLEPERWLDWILFAPLLASVLTLLVGKVVGERAAWIAVAGIAVSLVGSLVVWFGSTGADQPIQSIAPWFDAGSIQVRLVLQADAITRLMLVTVSLVSLPVCLYSIGYMHGDPGFARYFACFALFVFAMLGLVLAGNLILVYAFWEGVGLCSYLLIGFWFTRPSAAAAARKAFLVNRIGDCGFLLGILLLWHLTGWGSLDFTTVLDPANLDRLVKESPGLLTLAGFLLLCGAVGKSAQFPLHTWLPDAMEGPTPVSALIHAATMVTAGVYLLARLTPMLVLLPNVQVTVAVLGGITALLAALIAVTQYDLKRVLAYSTVSQLGYMFMALGAAAGDESLILLAVSAAMFHLFTHAFFKAALFLAAGSVMHAMGNVIDMRRLGGLHERLPVTHWVFCFGALALAGIPPFAGFWSKDEILAVLHEATHGPFGRTFEILLLVALGTVFLTAFYTFRAYFLVFWGAERIPAEAGPHAHESPRIMTYPMMKLAALAVLVGMLTAPRYAISRWLAPALGTEFHPHGLDLVLATVSTLLALGGIGLAWLLVAKLPAWGDRLGHFAATWRQASLERFYLDELYEVVLVRPLATLGRWLSAWDAWGLGRLVGGVGSAAQYLGGKARIWQSGALAGYSLFMAIGTLVLLLALVASVPTTSSGDPASGPVGHAPWEENSVPKANDRGGENSWTGS